MFGYKLVGDITVSSAQTSVSFTGLNITKDDDYLLVSDTPAGSYDNKIYVNNNATDANYYNQRIYALGATVGASRVNNPVYSSNQGAISYTKIKLTNNGYFVYQADSIYQNALSDCSLFKYYGASIFTMSSITSLTITVSVASQIKVGSRFRLYKLTAKKVADINVGTATTQIDITGLAIDKTSEYMLVSDIVNTATSTSEYLLYCNGNNTATNYWQQQLLANGTSVTGARVNFPTLASTSNGKTSFAITKIKLTNGGYLITQSNVALNYSTVNQVAVLDYMTAGTFTLTSINSLSVKSTIANAIGVGSRFQLYKLI